MCTVCPPGIRLEVGYWASSTGALQDSSEATVSPNFFYVPFACSIPAVQMAITFPSVFVLLLPWFSIKVTHRSAQELAKREVIFYQAQRSRWSLTSKSDNPDTWLGD